jgi:RNA polymerase sigma factor (sigma-70 family)
MATPPAPPDAELIARLQQRDRHAWEQLSRLYEARLYAFAYRLTGNSHDAADLVQETFVRALPRLDNLDPDRLSLSPYFFTTAGNLFLHDLGRVKPVEPVEMKRVEPVEKVHEPEESQLSAKTDPAGLLRRQLHAVQLANARLPRRQRLALALRELEDWSYAEIGELIASNEDTVAHLVSRARESLCDELRLGHVDDAALPADCRRLRPLLSAHLDGQLTESSRAHVLAHVAGCGHCRTALGEMREASGLYRQPVPAATLFQRVDEALAAVRYWDRPPARGTRKTLRRTRRLAGLVTGMALVALVVGVVAVYPLVDTPDWPKLAAEPQARSPLPDLVIAELTPSSVRVANVGKAAAGPFTVTVTGADTFSFTRLDTGKSAARSWPQCVRGTITATADPTSQVAESREQNNTRSIKTSC